MTSRIEQSMSRIPMSRIPIQRSISLILRWKPSMGVHNFRSGFDESITNNSSGRASRMVF
jgi:hypothetical protein